jgi:hypothetical protein
VLQNFRRALGADCHPPALAHERWTFETDPHHKWVVTILFDPLDRIVGVDVVNPALRGRGDPVDFNRAIVVTALANEADGIIKARALAALNAHVPLADVSGAITGGPQQRGVRDGIFREGRVIVGDAVEVVVTAREKRRATRRAERQRHKSVAETHALGREPVHVGRLEPRKTRPLALLSLHHAHRVPALVVGVDEEKIRLAVSGVGLGESSQSSQRQQSEEKIFFHG